MIDNTEEELTGFSKKSWAEKNGFAHWAIALIWLIVALVLFQVVAGVAIALFMFVSGDAEDTVDITTFMTDNVDLLFIGNSIGQVLFIGLATFLVVRLHLSDGTTRSFLRFKWQNDSVKYILYSALLVLLVQPIVIYLGYLNSLLPIPELFSDLQVSQYEMIENFLRTEGVILFGLFHVALIPAICEEVLFRGYILRAFEKSWGIILGIIISGIIFGMFHIQLGNIFPLAALGMILALMTWLSGSLWPAIVAHFINNGAAVVIGVNFPELLFTDVSADSLPPVWLLILSIICTAALVYVMHQQSYHAKK